LFLFTVLSICVSANFLIGLWAVTSALRKIIIIIIIIVVIVVVVGGGGGGSK